LTKNYQNRHILVFEAEKCAGCRICETVCSLGHVGEVKPSEARINIAKIEELGFEFAVFCQQCDERFCMDVCPVKAIQPDDNDVLVVNSEKCIGCGRCERACPYNGIKVTSFKKAVKCDLCGGDPMCVKHCPAEALQFVADEGGFSLLRLQVMDQLKILKVKTEEEINS